MLGEADAGVVYKTDITYNNRSELRVIDIRDKYNVIATYPISLLKDLNKEHKTAAAKFLDYLFSAEGGKIIENRGFVLAK